MPPTNTIWTLSNLDGQTNTERYGKSPTVRQQAAAASNSYTSITAAKNDTPSSTTLPFKVCCIPKLPNEKLAESLLLRVVREFQSILIRRGYNVHSISEMCCCNDGLDFQPNQRRKRRIMSANIWGYNQTTFGAGRKSHTIHIRLRHPSDHARLLPYEDVAGTLAHELSHCEHSNHNEAFYKLMDEILDEHATLMTSQLRQGGVPMVAFTGPGQTVGSVFGGTGNRLGGNHGTNNNNNQPSMNPRDVRGNMLGGDLTFTAWMTPAEAAVAAAEARRRQQQLRLRGDHCCRPCIIDLDEEENVKVPTTWSERVQDRSSGHVDSQNRINGHAPHKSTRRTLSLTDCIDLTEEEDYTGCDNPLTIHDTLLEWSCHQCTFRNRSLALSCDMCATERVYFSGEAASFESNA